MVIDGEGRHVTHTRLCHLGMPSHHEGTQYDQNKLEFWLGLNRSIHPHLAKWFPLHKSEEERASGVALVILPFPDLFSTILSIFEQRWQELKFQYPELPLASWGLGYPVHLHMYPQCGCRQV